MLKNLSKNTRIIAASAAAVAIAGGITVGALNAQATEITTDIPAIVVTEARTADLVESAPITGDITLAQAKQIALNYVGSGRVTYWGAEDDHGARWEIEVTRPGGSEVDVYVAANGQVVHTVTRG